MKAEKMVSNGLSIWWKGAPADGASVSPFKRREGRQWEKDTSKNGWAHWAYCFWLGWVSWWRGGAYTIYNEIFISHHLYSLSMPRLITDGTLLISPPFTFGLNLLFVFGGEDINTEGWGICVRRETKQNEQSLERRRKPTRGGFGNICMWMDVA